MHMITIYCRSSLAHSAISLHVLQENAISCRYSFPKSPDFEMECKFKNSVIYTLDWLQSEMLIFLTFIYLYAYEIINNMYIHVI